MKFLQHLGLGLKKPYFIVFILACFTATSSESRAHHKVHNLALYPERHSWCQATPIRQEIAHAPECHTKTIDNVVCLGACFSYSVPRAQDDPVIPPYCDACRPTISAWKVIILNCTKPITGEPYQLARNVEIISNCSCVDCNDNTPRAGINEGINSPEEETSQELQDPLFMSNNEVDEEEEDDGDVTPMDDVLPHVPTLHKLKSVSAEMKDANKAADEEEIMIKDNKIPADDDVDPDHDSNSNRITKERERQRSPMSISADSGEN